MNIWNGDIPIPTTPTYTLNRCLRCGGVLGEPASGYANQVTVCRCGSLYSSNAGYAIVIMRPDQYQEIIDRLNYLEILIERLTK